MIQDPQVPDASTTSGMEGKHSVEVVPALDRLAALVARLLQTPLALVSLVEEQRQKFPGMYGTLPEPFHLRQTPISHSFCQHVVRTGEPLVVQDARLDARVACNPAVQDLNVIAYLGMPLTTADGQVLGSLCAIDTVPRTWTEDEQNTLRELVGFALTELEAHRNERRLREAEQELAFRTNSERDRLIEAFRRSPSFIAVLREPQHTYEFVNDGYCQLVGRPTRDILGRTVREVLPEVEGQGLFELLDQVYATGKPYIGKDAPVLLQSAPGQPPVEHFVDFVFQPTFAPDGNVNGIFVQGVDWTERNLAQRETKRVAEQRRLALDSSQMGSWHFDLASERIHWDERFKAIFGVADEELSYERVVELLHPDDRENVRAAIAAASRPEDPVPYSIEYRVIHPDGSEHWVEAHGRTYFEGEGEARHATYLVGTVRDITEQHRAIATLAQASEQRRLALDSAELGWWHYDPATGLVDWDERTRVLYGSEAPRVDIEQVNAAIHPDDVGARRAAFQAAMQPDNTNPQYEVEYRVKLPDGSWRWLQIKGKATFAGEGSQRRVVGLDGTAGDVTMAKAAQAALQVKEATSRFLADLGEATRQTADPDAVLGVVVDALRAHLAANRCAYAEVEEDQDTIIIRYDSTDPTGSGHSLVGLHRLSGFGERMLPTLRAGKTVVISDVATDPLIADARDAMASVGVVAVVNVPLVKTGRLVAVLAVHEAHPRDWTAEEIALIEAVAERSWGEVERSRNVRALAESEARFRQMAESERAARTQAERTSQMKDEFLATLSHELRTPLNAILGWTQVLRGDPNNTEDMEAGLATIERNSRAQTQIIEDLLDMSKIISGKVRLDVQPLDLDRVVAASVETMRPAAAAKGIRLQALIDPQARAISGDPNRLQQVFWNLLTNAIKFTPRDGKVQVVLERVNSHLEVSVADTGEGIAPDFLPYVFDRFRQQDASTTRKHGGLGLGLAIVKQLVELHGGSINVESTGPGRGTTFRVALPLSVVQEPTSHPTAPDERRHPQVGSVSVPIPTNSLHLAGLSVLVVDDEADVRELVKRLLEDREVEDRIAGSVAESMDLFLSRRPDVLISDIGMPQADGYELIRQVRALPAEQGGSVPAVALTAYARADDRLKSLLAGFQTHLAKPVEAAELLTQVASLAGRVAVR